MKTSFRLKLVLVAAGLIFLCGCPKPEGPGQRLGRSIDELSQSFKDIGKDWKDDEQENRDDRRYGDERDYDRSYSRDTVTPEHDPYYDTPPNSRDYDREEADRLERERRNQAYRPERY
jgi:hypothetical protein